MTIYLVILTLTAVGIVGYDLRADASRRWLWLFWGVMAALTGVAGLRYHCGIDTWQYASALEGGADLKMLVTESSDYNIFDRHLWLYAILRQSGLGVVGLQMIFALVLNGLLGRFVVRNTRCIFTAILLYEIFAYFNLNFEVMREGGAIAIMLWAWDDLLNLRCRSSRLRYALKTLLALMIHFSAVVMIVLPLLNAGPVVRALRLWRHALLTIAGALILSLGVRVMLYDVVYPLIESHFSDCLMADYFNFKLRGYAPAMSPMRFGLAGYVGHLAKYLLYPLAGAWLLTCNGRGRIASAFGLTASDAVAPQSSESQMLARMMEILAIVGVMALGCSAAWRLNNWFILPFVVGLSRGLARMGRKWEWWLAMIPLLALRVYAYSTPVAISRHGHQYNLYIPYTNYIERKADPLQDSLILEHRRLWLGDD